MSKKNFVKKTNLLKGFIFERETGELSEQAIKGLLRSNIAPLIDSQTPSIVLSRILNKTGLEGILKRLEFANAQIFDCAKNEPCDKTFETTEFLLILSTRYNAVMIWDYENTATDSTDKGKKSSKLYLKLNSKHANEIAKIICDVSNFDIKDFITQYVCERRSNKELNLALNNIADFVQTFQEETMLEACTNVDNLPTKQDQESSDKNRLIAHDIRNHLSIINLYSKIIEKKSADSSVKKTVKTIKKSVNLAIALLSELRSTSKIDLKAYMLDDLIKNVIEIIKVKAEEKNVNIEYKNNFSGEVLVDSMKFENIMINIILNALEAVDKNGEVSIKTAINENLFAQIIVENNGKPITEKNKSEIFSQGFSTKNGGSGLGLYICKMSIEEQFGQIKLLKSDAVSTQFEITIPAL